MKPKRLLMIHHADGREEYICRSCNQPLRHCDDSHMSFGRGDVEESGGEYLFCDTCGIREDYPKIPDEHFLNYTLDV